jgi:S-formylglutathione hydrolase FrmB
MPVARSRFVVALIVLTVAAVAATKDRSRTSSQAPAAPALSPSRPTTQVTAVKAVHRDGQTFVTWQEIGSPPPSVLTMKEVQDLEKSLSANPPVRYRVYRSAQPIERLSDAVLVGEQSPLSGWNVAYRGRAPGPTDQALRYVIQDGGQPLPTGIGVLVHNPPSPGQAYYAVTAVVAGKEVSLLTAANRAGPVAETTGAGTPVLQRTEKPGAFHYIDGPTLHIYVRWEPTGNASRPGQPFDYLVAIPPGVKNPAPVGIHLHEWGGSMYGLYGWWLNAEKGAVLVASTQEPYDWWTGYHEQYYGPRPHSESAWKTGVVRPYTQTRLLSFVDWLETRLPLDRSRMFVTGSSMGGSGSLMMAIRHPKRVAWALSHVGVHVPRESPQFKASYELVWGPPEWNVKFEDGTPVWDYFDDAEYIRRHPDAEIGFMTFSNSKNDHAIGWSQAVRFVRALQEARQPHMFVWSTSGHDGRAQMPDGGGERVNPLDLRVDQSLPAFTRGSLDDAPGDGDPSTGARAGQINAALAWTPSSIRDEQDEWSITLRLAQGAAVQSGTADVTPRRLQRFKLRAGDRVRWTNQVNGREVQTGEVVADQWGLVTLPQVQIDRSGSRLIVRRSSRTSP